MSDPAAGAMPQQPTEPEVVLPPALASIVRMAVQDGEITPRRINAQSGIRRNDVWKLRDMGFLEYKIELASTHTEWRPTAKATRWVEMNSSASCEA